MKGKVTCPKCSFVFVVEGEREEDKTVKCPKCGYEFIARVGKVKDVRWIEYGGTRKAILPIPGKGTKRPFVAGILLFLVFLINMATILLYYLSPGNLIWTPYDIVLEGKEIFLTMILILLSILLLAGSYCSIRKISISLPIVGCVSGVLSFGFLVIGPFLSLVSLALILLSREEFEKGSQGKEF
ncbi:MAG TPA: hypothetical protein ENG60_02160 [Thermoplasmatales archaeon]|nr:hypothetical protein [Thermoplasmatales archaeon]HEX17205.1 hypothetical protein [Thermoplasmatales archaeon]